MRVLPTLACVLAAAGCFPPDLGDGAIGCGSDGACPPHYYCHQDTNRCYKSPGGSGGDGGVGADLSGTDVFDFSGVDFSNCMQLTCVTGQCGLVPNGCGQTMDCGNNCPMGESCGGGGVAHQCGCPTEVTCNGKNCGTMPNGCGGVIDCGGMCPAPNTCGGSGTANVCGIGLCTPKTCRPNRDCGLISDGCSAVLNCGACAGGKSCINSVCQ